MEFLSHSIISMGGLNQVSLFHINLLKLFKCSVQVPYRCSHLDILGVFCDVTGLASRGLFNVHCSMIGNCELIVRTNLKL